MKPTVVTTMWAGDDPAWTERTTLVDRRRHRTVIGFLREFLRLSRSADCVVVVGALGFTERYRDLVGIALLKLRRRRPAVVVSEATWDVGSAALAKRLGSDRLVRALVRRGLPFAIDGSHVTYCVLSTAELSTLPAAWRIDAERVVFTPFSTTMWGHLDDPTWDGGYVFSGGDSLRDYDLLVDAVRDLPVPVRVATRGRSRHEAPNVTVRSETADDYDQLLRGARVVVVPLRSGVRSAGQQTYLNAMALGKPVVVTDAPGVRDYIDDGFNGLVVEPEPAALRAALAWALDPFNQSAVSAMAINGRHTARHGFTPARYRARLLEVAEETIARMHEASR